MLAGDSVQASCEKSTLPISRPSGGMMIFSTSAVTILPKAAPITTPTARSMTLPRIANSLNSVMSAGDHAVALGHVLQSGTEAVAGLQRSHPGRGAHEHQVAGAQLPQLGQLMQDLRHVPDHLVEQRLLAHFAVDLQRQVQRGQVTNLGGMHDLADRRGGIKALGGIPRP
ncbi:hypothetical protein G6F40_014653 [Rhizopus arrhizus]|nr:hypothetical protein G6F31_016901 [Rhizopus arrhizus]KAG1083824.1 hypothetical protein G6F40_014653 [Rhizopus arrhizus]